MKFGCILAEIMLDKYDPLFLTQLPAVFKRGKLLHILISNNFARFNPKKLKFRDYNANPRGFSSKKTM